MTQAKIKVGPYQQKHVYKGTQSKKSMRDTKSSPVRAPLKEKELALYEDRRDQVRELLKVEYHHWRQELPDCSPDRCIDMARMAVNASLRVGFFN